MVFLGLAKVSVGTKLEGTSSSIQEYDKKYKYTHFNGSEGELFHWNEDFNL